MDEPKIINSININGLKIDILRSATPVEYTQAYKYMQDYQADVIAGTRNSSIWLLEHEPVITAGRSYNKEDLLMKDDETEAVPICYTERGGQFTFHNPGQRIVYFMINIKELYDNNPDIRRFVQHIEQALINTLNVSYGFSARLHDEHIGIWVEHQSDLYKIASVGLNVKKWVTMHGMAININNDLFGYQQIVPCGMKDYSMISMQKVLGRNIDLREFDRNFINHIATTMG